LYWMKEGWKLNKVKAYGREGNARRPDSHGTRVTGEAKERRRIRKRLYVFLAKSSMKRNREKRDETLYVKESAMPIGGKSTEHDGSMSLRTGA